MTRDQPLRGVIGSMTFAADLAVTIAEELKRALDLKDHGFTEAASTKHIIFPFMLMYTLKLWHELKKEK